MEGGSIDILSIGGCDIEQGLNQLNDDGCNDRWQKEDDHGGGRGKGGVRGRE